MRFQWRGKYVHSVITGAGSVDSVRSSRRLNLVNGHFLNVIQKSGQGRTIENLSTKKKRIFDPGSCV